MQIENNMNISNQNQQILQDITVQQDHKEIGKGIDQLMPGDQFRATITDIKPSLITIRLAGGESIEARTLILPEARIGEDSFFAIRENNNGQILLEMLKPDNNVAGDLFAKQLLESTGFFPSQENISVVKMLIENQMPVDANTIQKALYFFHGSKETTLEDVLFLIKEDFPPNMQSINHLCGIKTGGDGLNLFLQQLADTVRHMDDGAVKSQIIEILDQCLGRENGNADNSHSMAGNKSINAEQVLKNLFLNPYEITGEKTSQHFSNLYEAMRLLTDLSNQEGSTKGWSKFAKQTKDIIRFMNQISVEKEYFQLPVYLANAAKETELHVFKEANRKKDLSKQASMLLALQFQTLGAVDIYINRTDKSVSLQFQAPGPETLTAIQNNILKLSDALTNKGFQLGQISYQKIVEPSNVTETNYPGKKAPGAPKIRYTFDMHV